MLHSERRSLIRFLVIYLSSTFLLFSLAGWIFYRSTVYHILDKQRDTIIYEGEIIKSNLRQLHQSNKIPLYYPYNSLIHSAIFDKDRKYIFGTFLHIPTLEDTDKNGVLYHISKVEPYYLGAVYLLTSRKIDMTPIYILQKNFILFMLGAGVFFSTLGYFLGRLFVAPMRDSITRMNHFIQDTTHELNTPISTILTNVEMIETFGKHEENSAELQRIEIASKTLSRIYDDLTYLNLNHHYHRQIVTLNMSALLQERIVYFTAMAKAKDVKIHVEITSNVMQEMDKNDAIRLVDNLISNAIKYNKLHGTLTVRLNEEYFSVEDTGIGIKAEDIRYVFDRFKRVNKSEGGFGIGLDIVNQVVYSYNFDLEIHSEEQKGTEVKVKWKK